MRIALERFSDSYARRKRVDKLIDLAICLEALFGDHGQREKGRLIADKASCLVAGDELSAEALVARREIRDLYRARNAAVHGGICDVNSETLLRWKQLVRLCLRRYLQREANSQ